MHEGEKAFRDLLEGWKDDPEFVAEGIALELSVAINSALKSLRMNQKQLAEKIHVSPGRVSQIMGGNLNLTLLTMCKVALGVGLRPSLTFSAIEHGATPATVGETPVGWGTVSEMPSVALGAPFYSALLNVPVLPRASAGGSGLASTVAEGGGVKGAAA